GLDDVHRAEGEEGGGEGEDRLGVGLVDEREDEQREALAGGFVGDGLAGGFLEEAGFGAVALGEAGEGGGDQDREGRESVGDAEPRRRGVALEALILGEGENRGYEHWGEGAPGAAGGPAVAKAEDGDPTDVGAGQSWNSPRAAEGSEA